MAYGSEIASEIHKFILQKFSRKGIIAEFELVPHAPHDFDQTTITLNSHWNIEIMYAEHDNSDGSSWISHILVQDNGDMHPNRSTFIWAENRSADEIADDLVKILNSWIK